MGTTNETGKGWLESLRALPDPAKKKILTVTAIVFMAIVIYFWLAYFNNLIAGVMQSSGVAQGGVPADGASAPVLSVTAESAPVANITPAAAAPATPVAPGAAPQTANAQNVPGIWQRLGNGAALIYGAFANIGRTVSGFFQAQGSYTIQPSQLSQ